TAGLERPAYRERMGSTEEDGFTLPPTTTAGLESRITQVEPHKPKRESLLLISPYTGEGENEGGDKVKTNKGGNSL
ncbi:MAG: hypothetical protein ABEJ25_02915, partial [Candidatus Bipolaricaulia bacterium]